MGKNTGAADRELSAMSVIIDALEGLEGESVQRVLDYVFSRLSISATKRMTGIPSVPGPTPVFPTDYAQRPRMPSIRDLKEEKQPESSNQMAALVAYYLSEVAGDGERKGAINAADIEKYFKQAAYKLPKSVNQTLPNAAAAGYFEGEGGGMYRLNAVGYNLVVHGLPRSQFGKGAEQKRARGKKSSRRPNRAK